MKSRNNKKNNSKKIEEEESDSTESIISTEEEEESKENTMENTKLNSKFNMIKSTAITGVYFIYDTSKIYMLWIALHFIASQIYSPICSPYSIWGFIITPILAVTPQCRALRWVINTGGNTMETMWLIFGTWVCSKIIPCATNAITFSSNPKPSYNRERTRSYDNNNNNNNHTE